MRVSIDGGETWIECGDGVRIDLNPENELEADNITLNFTDEGMIADLWAPTTEQQCLNTACVPYDEIRQFLFGRD